MPDQRSFWQHFVLSPGKIGRYGRGIKIPINSSPTFNLSRRWLDSENTKSSFNEILGVKVNSLAPSKVDIKIIDAMYFLHLHSNLPATFGGVSRFLLSRIMESEGSIIHFVSDQWVTPSIKDCERETRAANVLAYQIKSSSQQRPSNWIAALKSASFKDSLISFLLKSWLDDCHTSTLRDKILLANNKNSCFKFFVGDGKMCCEEVTELHSNHEEADNRMFFHLAKVNGPSNVVIRTADTDCLIIGLATQHMYQESMHVGLEVGTLGKNNLRFISLNQLYSYLGNDFCAALPAYHAFTGCDYTASFCRRGCSDIRFYIDFAH